MSLHFIKGTGLGKLTLIFLLISFCSCSAQMELPGLVAYQPYPEDLRIYAGKKLLKKTKLKQIAGKEKDIKYISYSGFNWFNNKDLFICQEHLESTYWRKSSLKGSLVVSDISGKIVDTIYLAKTYEFVLNYNLSSSDNKVVFSSAQHPDTVDLFFEPLTIHVVDMKTKKELRTLKDFCWFYNFNAYESCWSPDESKFVYSLTDWRKFSSQKPPPPVRPLGIYYYDIVKDEHIKVSDYGENPLWSPLNDTIAYILDWRKIMFYSYKTKEVEVFYEPADNEKITAMHWSPDGEYLLIAGNTVKGDRKKPYERLIKISTKEIVKYKSIGITDSYFSWKKGSSLQ